MKIKIRIESKSWRPSILKGIQENKYCCVLPNSDVTTRQEREIFESIFEEEIIEEIEDLDELEEVDENFEIVETEDEEIKFEIIDNYFCEFDFKILPNWVQVGRFLIPENQFREVILQEDRKILRREFGRGYNNISCLLKGCSTKDIFLQKDILKVKYPIPMQITKQLEKEIRGLDQKERKTFGRIIKSSNLRNVDWKFMTIKKINFIAKSTVFFSKEESRLSLKKLRELENKKIQEKIKMGEFREILDENPKKGCKLLDKNKHPIKPFFYEKEGFTIRSPKNYMELYNEGLRMENCIGKLHSAPIAEGKEFPLFLEKKGVIIAHLLLNKYNEIQEVRMKRNRNPNKRIEEFIEEFGKKFGFESEYKNQYGYDQEGFVEPFF